MPAFIPKDPNSTQNTTSSSKVNPQLSSLQNKWNDVKDRYSSLEQEYGSLSLQVQLNLQHHECVQNFWLAAILRHTPSETTLLSIVCHQSQARSSPGGDEECPLSTAWFKDIDQARGLLILHRSGISLTDSSAALLEKLLTNAERSVSTVARWLSNGQLVGRIDQVSDVEDIINEWSGICKAVRLGTALKGALYFDRERLRDMAEKKPSSFPYTKRGFFPYGVTYDTVFNFAGIKPERRTHEHIYSESTAPANTPEPKPKSKPPVELPAAYLNDYNRHWDNLSSERKDSPVPSKSLDTTGLLRRKELSRYTHARIRYWADKQIMKANAQVFLLRGLGLRPRFGDARGKVNINFKTKTEQREALLRQLKRKEAVRWHPDRINLRTGERGRLDEGIGKQAHVVAIRSAVQDLIDYCETSQS